MKKLLFILLSISLILGCNFDEQEPIEAYYLVKKTLLHHEDTSRLEYELQWIDSLDNGICVQRFTLSDFYSRSIIQAVYRQYTAPEKDTIYFNKDYQYILSDIPKTPNMEKC